ncbi:MAG TPA: PASTA domain-containing protein [Egibacteraceae bacterium]|nr:PASTA domain-containing protein [Egibacteraceae bacterium]
MDRALETEPSADAIAVGALLGGRYRLTSRIGAGGMATIFQARDEALERGVAIKVLHEHLADDPGILARFRTEARHAASLSHPHIVNVYDQGAAGLPYIVMEHVDGPSLREVLLQRGRLSPGEAVSVVAPVCAALARAHAAGLIHRDVKPENVLIDADGAPKVVDFGIARALSMTSHTQTGMLVGSVHYMAPELVDGREATPASDQYALGVMLFELLADRKPLPADTPMGVALRHAREEIPRPSQFAPGISPQLDEVVARATASDPARRFGDLAGFAAALKAAVPDGPVPVVFSQEADGVERTLVIPAVAQDTIALARGVGRRPAPPKGSPAGDDAQARARQASRAHGRGRRALRRALIAALVALAVVTALAGAGYAVWDRVVAPLTDIPDLTELSQGEALEQLDPLGLGLVVEGSEHSRTVPEGHILSQAPEAGETLRRGEDVVVITSGGPGVVEMPEVVTLPLDEARSLLEGEPHFFAVDVDEAHHDEAPAGQIIAQNPAPGERLRQDSRVRVQVSLGIEQVEVPALGGLTLEEAEQILAEGKLALGDFTSQEYSDEQPTAGLIISQDLSPGATVDKGSAVSGVVSKGPLTIEMPNVRGKGIKDATAELEALGLVVSVDGQPRPSFGPFRQGKVGRVEEQLPQAGQAVRRGDSVTLYTFTE